MYEVLANISGSQQANCTGLLYWSAWVLILFQLVMQSVSISKKLGYSQGLMIAVVSAIAGSIVFILALSMSLVTRFDRRKNGLFLAAGLSGTMILSAIILTITAGFFNLVVAIGLIAVAETIRNYFTETKQISIISKLGLCALRILVIALACFWVINPVSASTITKTSRAKIIIAVDKSASMNRKDMPVNLNQKFIAIGQKAQPRIASVKKTLLACKDKIAKLKSIGIDVDFFSFSDKLFAPPTQDFDRFYNTLANLKSLSTNIGDSMLAGVSPIISGSEPVAGVIMLSDGCNNYQKVNSPADFARGIKASQVDLYPIVVGSVANVSKEKTLNIVSLKADDTLNTCTETEIIPTISACNLSGQTLEIICKFGTKTIGKKRIKITKKICIEKLVFAYTPLKPGSYKISVAVRIVENSGVKLLGKKYISKLINVTDKAINVLYIEGKYRYESKYISRAIGAHEKINLTRYTILKSAADSKFEIDLSGEKFANYHLIIIGDVPAKYFSKQQIAMLVKSITEHGRGLCMIGGYKSFGAGGWDKTELTKIMPVDLAKSKFQISSPVKIIPTKYAADSVLMKISDKYPMKKAWSLLDKMPGANKLAGVKPAAEILAKSQDGYPMIVTHRAGAGRVTAVAFDTTWRWVLAPGKHDTAKLQKRFWQQVVLSLTAPKENVWIETNKTQYDLTNLNQGENIVVTAGVSGVKKDRKPKISARLIELKSKKVYPVALEFTGKNYRAILQKPNAPGVYKLEAKLKTAKGILVADHRFEIIFEDRESREVLANINLLNQLAAISNTQVYHIYQLEEILNLIAKKYKPVKTHRITTTQILAPFRCLFVIVLLVLICAEWFLRKKKSLV